MSAKKQEFAIEHCWVLLKDHPKWADGWSAPKAASTSTKHMAQSSSPPANCTENARTSGVCANSGGDGLDSQQTRLQRPGGTKAAREELRSAHAREGAIYAQAAATRTMAEAQMKKAALLEDQNMLLLMTMPEDKITTAEAREYLRLRRGDELKKLRHKLAAEEDREHSDAANVEEEVARSSATKRRRQSAGLGSQYEEGEGRSLAAVAAATALWELLQTARRRRGLRSSGRRRVMGRGAPTTKTARSLSHRVPGETAPQMRAWVGGLLGRLAVAENKLRGE
jgi:hypothetical protein